MIRVPPASDRDIEVMLLHKFDAFDNIVLIFYVDYKRLIAKQSGQSPRERHSGV